MLSRLAAATLLFVSTPAFAKDFVWKTETFNNTLQMKVPGTMTPTEQKVPTEIGEITATLWIYEHSNTNAWMTGMNDYPKGSLASDVNVVLDGARDGAVANTNGKLVSEKKITIDGWPGRELVIAAESEGLKLVTVARVVLVDNRLVQALVVSSEDAKNDADVRTFLDSMKIVKGKAGATDTGKRKRRTK